MRLTRRPMLAVALAATLGFVSIGISPSGTPAASTCQPEHESAEIAALAAGLHCDPVAVYNYVHDHIDFVPTWGLLQSPSDTVLAGAGNAFDQAALLVALLTASGYEANYVLGTVEIPTTDAQSWVGVKGTDALEAVLRNGWYTGFEIDGTALRVEHVWVQAEIEGEVHAIDPSFKSYNSSPAVDLSPVLDFRADEFLSRAVAGAVVADEYISRIDLAAVAADLNTYSEALQVHLRDNHPFAYASDILGGREIEPREADSLPAELPFRVVAAAEPMVALPSTSANHWRIQAPGIDYSAPLADLVGRRLTVFFEPASPGDRDAIAQAGSLYDVYPAYSVRMRPHVAVGGDEVAVGEPQYLGSDYPVLMTVKTAVLDDEGEPYVVPFDEDRSSLIVGESYAMVFSASGISPSALRRQHAVLKDGLALGNDMSSEPVLGQSLHLIGLSWLSQGEESSRLDAALADVVRSGPVQGLVVSQDLHLEHREVGGETRVVRVAKASYTVDVVFRTVRFVSPTGDSDAERAFLIHSTLRLSAAEGAVVEQLQGVSAVSAVRLIHLAQDSGMRVYHVTAANQQATMRALQLPDSYKTAVLQPELNAGRDLFVPERPLAVHDWYGVGVISFDPDSGSMSDSITGGIGWASASTADEVMWTTQSSGGMGADAATIQPEKIADALADGPILGTGCNDECDRPDGPNAAGPDVVDTATGSFLYNHVDVAFGSLGPTIAFERTYVSGRHRSSGAVGPGWTHSYELHASESSDWQRAFGYKAAIDASAAIAEGWVGLELARRATATGMHAEMMVLDEACDWMLRGVTENAVAVKRQSGLAKQFLRLPDGSYAPSHRCDSQLQELTPSGYALIEEDGTRLEYDGEGRAIRIVDADGNVTALGYDGSGRLATVTDPAGRAVSLAYSGDRLVLLRDPLGRAFGYEYDGAGRLVQATDAQGRVTTYAYDAADRIVTVTDPDRLNVVNNAYDELGRVATQTDGRGGVTGFVYGPVATTVSDREGHASVFTFDRYRRLETHEDQLRHRVTRSYDSGDNVVELVEPAGAKWRVDYDQSGNAKQVTDPLGRAYEFKHDGDGHLTRATDAAGRVTAFVYDVRGNVTRRTDAAGQTERYDYDENGRLVGATDANGNALSFTYDASGDLVQVIDSLGGSIAAGYDEVSRITSVTDANGATTAIEYDTGDNIVAITDPLGYSSTFSYGLSGLVTSAQDKRGGATQYAYDGQLNLVAVTDALGGVTRYSYDGEDRLVAITDANGETTRYERDASGRIVGITDPLGRATRFDRDAAGNVIARTTADGRLVRFAYDAVGRLVGVTDGADGDTSFSYDDADNLVAISRGGWSQELEYDDLDRLVAVRQPQDGIRLTHAYDAGGNRLSTTVRRDDALVYDARYLYDSVNRVSRAEDDLGALWVAFERDANGSPTRVTMSNGAATAFEYDARGAVTRLEHRDGEGELIRGWTYRYDEQGLPVEVGNLTAWGTHPTVYSYDALGQLTAEQWPRYRVTYSYDAVGNRVRTDSSQGEVTYRYDAANQLLQAGEMVFTWDPRGNQTGRSDARGDYQLDYDDWNRLQAIREPGGWSTTFDYDPLGRVVEASDALGTTQLSYDGTSAILEWRGEEVAAAHLHADGMLVASRRADGTASSAVRFYHGDVLGSVSCLTDAAGRAVAAFGSDAFGVPQVAAGMPDAASQFVGQLGVRSTIAGGWLLQMGFRNYSPDVARFTARDPLPGSIGDPRSLHPYVYAYSSPLAFLDPLGLYPQREDNEVLSQLSKVSEAAVGIKLLERIAELEQQGDPEAMRTAANELVDTLRHILKRIDTISERLERLEPESGYAKDLGLQKRELQVIVQAYMNLLQRMAAIGSQQKLSPEEQEYGRSWQDAP